ncbi:corrinoid protein [Thermanaerothrix sp. 4228-RoL]|uniref:Corrinoid protein n=1 Tax=Thermanaerothrix solaris TaxID=3058434 RepID=A0ABU3NK17_9CHLR|nr:corrinoid protein [Thermanaerothrix sp. 4228-RoL]MDT8897195.1 corrinoid protein [Thermanaerothrix sp. 4228-RoL]
MPDVTIASIFQAVVDGNTRGTLEGIEQALEQGLTAEAILSQGLIAAMREVGRLFEEGEYFVPEMLVAARAMQAGLNRLRPLLVAQGIQPLGKVVLGTVKGDLHDIGKNLVGMMLEGAGFEVIDLGTDVSPEKFLAAIEEHQPHLLGMSALLTTTMSNMKLTLEILERAQVRERVRVMIGGAPVTEGFARQIGADGYAPDASRAVALAKHLLSTFTEPS